MNQLPYRITPSPLEPINPNRTGSAHCSERLERKLKDMIVELTAFKVILKWPIPKLCDGCGENVVAVSITNPATPRKPIFLCKFCEQRIEQFAHEMAAYLGIEFI